MADIRTWHADGPPTELFGPEPPKSKAQTVAPSRPTAPSPPRPERHRVPTEPVEYLSGLVGQGVVVYLLASAGEDAGPMLYGTLAGVRKYEVALDTLDGRRLILLKTALAFVEVSGDAAR